MKILTAAQMREADRRTIEELGLPGVVLMECAGRAVVEAIEERCGDLAPGPVAILCGKGNNGGDGLVVARHLLDRGWQVKVVLLADAAAIAGDARLNLEILRRLPADISVVTGLAALEALLPELSASVLLVDALLGTGLATPVEGLYARAIDWINTHPSPVVAVDIPSGLDATSGCVLGAAVQADLTVTFAAAKLGEVIHPGVALCGELLVADIGIPQSLLAVEACGILLDADEVAPLLPPRPANGHKGSFGHLLLVAGSSGKSGAAAMAATAALRAGAGLVTVAAPQATQTVLALKLTEAMTAPLAEVDGGLALAALDELQRLWRGKTVLAIGPGLGQGAETVALVRRLLREVPLPLVIDADGLNALAGDLAALQTRPCGTTILTPHPGEMARLAGISVAEVEADRVGVARAFAETHGVIVVLKGARTVIAAADGGIFINPTGHAGLASGGSGDVLTGMIAGLLAQGAAPVAAACSGVWLHGRAADRLLPRSGTAGLLATDLLPEIPAARLELSPSGG